MRIITRQGKRREEKSREEKIINDEEKRMAR